MSCLPSQHPVKELALLTMSFLYLSGCIHQPKDFHPENFGIFFYRLDTVSSVARSGKILDELDSALKVLPAGAGDKARFFERKASYNMQNVNYIAAMQYTDSLMLISRTRLSNELFARLYTNALLGKGDIHVALNNYDEGLKYYAEGKSYAESMLKDTCIFSAYHTRIGNIYFALTRYQLAAKHFIEAYQEELDCKKDPFDQFVYGQMNLTNAGLAYANAHMNDSAEFYYQKALQFIDARKAQFPHKASYIKLCIGVAEGNYGDIRFRQARYSEAETFYRNSIQKTASDLSEYTYSCRMSLARMYTKWGKESEAEREIMSLDLSAPFFSRPKSKLMLYETFKEWMEAKKNPHEALRYSNLYIALKDSIDLQKKNDIERDMAKEMENKEQKIANELLRKENQVKSSQLVVIGLLAAITIIISYFAWYNLKRTKKYARTLATLNKTIKQSNEEIRSQNFSLQKAYLSLEDINRRKTRIMRAVAHDLKNPISGIHNLAFSLLRKPQPADLCNTLELIKSASSNSLILINDLVKGDVADKIADKTSVDVTDLTAHCIDLLLPRAETKSQQIEFDHFTPVYALINQEKIWRVINNIINNAIKFSGTETAIVVDIRASTPGVVLSVKDSGIGIPDTIKNKIFTLDSESFRAGTMGEESNGLGLIISKEIMEEHGGAIWFESAEGLGTTFYISLPHHIGSEQEAEQEG